MDRSLFHEANWAYQRIRQAEEKKKKIFGLKDQIIEILKGHTEIPEDELLDVFMRIKGLAMHLDKAIEHHYKTIDNL